MAENVQDKPFIARSPVQAAVIVGLVAGTRAVEEAAKIDPSRVARAIFTEDRIAKLLKALSYRL